MHIVTNSKFYHTDNGKMSLEKACYRHTQNGFVLKDETHIPTFSYKKDAALFAKNIGWLVSQIFRVDLRFMRVYVVGETSSQGILDGDGSEWLEIRVPLHTTDHDGSRNVMVFRKIILAQTRREHGENDRWCWLCLPQCRRRLLPQW